jgi:hypothetical protein
MSTQALPYRPLKAPPPDADRTRALLASAPRVTPKRRGDPYWFDAPRGFEPVTFGSVGTRYVGVVDLV